jgi:hypothetical protein
LRFSPAKALTPLFAYEVVATGRERRQGFTLRKPPRYFPTAYGLPDFYLPAHLTAEAHPAHAQRRLPNRDGRDSISLFACDWGQGKREKPLLNTGKDGDR